MFDNCDLIIFLIHLPLTKRRTRDDLPTPAAPKTTTR